VVRQRHGTGDVDFGLMGSTDANLRLAFVVPDIAEICIVERSEDIGMEARLNTEASTDCRSGEGASGVSPIQNLVNHRMLEIATAHLCMQNAVVEFRA